MEKQSIIKALERARDEIANALNLINSGVINPPAQAAASDDSFGDSWPETPPAAEPAKRGRKPKAPSTPMIESDPFAEAMADADAPETGGDDSGDFFSEQPPVDTGPTEKAVNDALVAAVTRLVEKAKSAGKDMKKTEARDSVLSALEKKFGDKNPAKLKSKWAEIITYFTPKK